MLDYRILGPFDVRTGSGDAVPLGRRKQRLLLAVLLLHRAWPMTPERLIDILWDDAPPASATANLHAYLSNLRQALAAAEHDRNPIRRQSGRYELDVRPEQVDADQARLFPSRNGRSRLAVHDDPGARRVGVYCLKVLSQEISVMDRTFWLTAANG